MTISEKSTTFHGKKVAEYVAGEPASASPATTVYRLALEYDAEQSMSGLLLDFLAGIDQSKLEALVIGAWNEPHDEGPREVLDELIRLAPQLPSLKALFVGDITYEECEISWIIQGEYAGLLAAYPQLEELRIRGSTNLELPPFTHSKLRSFAIECGGLPQSVLSALARSSMPALEHLELWIGTDGYGFDGNLATVRETVNALRTPGLRYLGLRDAEIADDIAAWLAGEAWVASLHTLDLSLGTLSDIGANALLASPHVGGLKKLDLSHHYISEPLQARLRAAIPGVVLADHQDGGENERYVAVGE
jgi:hypothetical protein